MTWKGFLGGPVVKNPPANAEDVGGMGSIPGLGRSPGVGNDIRHQYSCQVNAVKRGAWWAIIHGVAKTGTQLSDWACRWLKNRNAFLTALLTRKSSGLDRTWSGSKVISLLGLQVPRQPLFLVSSLLIVFSHGKERKAENEKTLLFLLLVRKIIPSWGFIIISSSNPTYLSKIPPPNTITLGIRISTYEFGVGDIKFKTDIESLAAVPLFFQCVSVFNSISALGKNPC